jgi:hypothetical protein
MTRRVSGTHRFRVLERRAARGILDGIAADPPVNPGANVEHHDPPEQLVANGSVFRREGDY